MVAFFSSLMAMVHTFSGYSTNRFRVSGFTVVDEGFKPLSWCVTKNKRERMSSIFWVFIGIRSVDGSEVSNVEVSNVEVSKLRSVKVYLGGGNNEYIYTAWQFLG